MKLLQNVRVLTAVGDQAAGTARSFPMLSAARWRALLVALVAALGMTLALALPAHAHAQLLSSSPADGAKLSTAPKSVVFKFGEKLFATGNAITATNVKSGNRVKLPAITVKGAKLSVKWPSSAVAGTYRVAYRAVSADGHPVTGRISFSYRKTLKASASEPVESASPIAERMTPPATDAASALAPAPMQYPVNVTVLLLIVGCGAVGLLIAGLAAWATHRRLG